MKKSVNLETGAEVVTLEVGDRVRPVDPRAYGRVDCPPAHGLVPRREPDIIAFIDESAGLQLRSWLNDELRGRLRTRWEPRVWYEHAPEGT